MYFKKNWGSMAEKRPPFGRIGMFQTSPNNRRAAAAVLLILKDFVNRSKLAEGNLGPLVLYQFPQCISILTFQRSGRYN